MVETEGRSSLDDAGSRKKPEEVGTGEKATEYDVQFLDAAEYGRDEEAASLISHGASLRARSKTGETALHLAARYGHATTIDLLLKASEAVRGEAEHKALSIDAQDDDGWTALYGACLNGYDSVVQLLLERGAKIDIKSKNGWTSLQKACQEDYKSVVQLLLKYELDVEAKNSDGETALHVAARNGHALMVELLLKHGVNINARDNDGWTALYGAANGGHKEAVDTLLQNKIDVNAAVNDGWTASHTACHKGHKEVLKSIISNQADLTIKTSQGETPLHVAARSGHSALIPLLLEANVPLEARDNDAWTPLYSASHGGHGESVEILLSRHADIEVRTKAEWTVLHVAAHKGHREVVQILLKHGAAIDAVTEEDDTAMHLAAAEGHRLVILELLKYLDDVGKAKALHNAASQGDYMIFSEVMNDNYDVIEAQKYVDGPFLFTAASSGQWDVVRLLLEQVPAADFGGKDTFEEKTLIWAAKNDEKMVRQLLGKKVANLKAFKLGVTDSWTALHWGAFHGHFCVIYWLLANGASAAIKDRDGYTPQMVAEKMLGNDAREALLDRPKDQNKTGLSEQEREKRRGTIYDEGRDKDKAGPPLEDKYKLSLDVLKNPPIIQGRPESGALFNAPALKRNSAEEIVCKEWDATIIDFSIRAQQVDLLRRSRSVYDVIYKDGPEKIMSTAKKELAELRKNIISDEKGKENSDSKDVTDDTSDTSSEDESGSDSDSDSNSNDTTDNETSSTSSDSNSDGKVDTHFRWVHLPANNMTWMEDLLTRTCLDQKIEKKDYHSISKFLRYSWYELPGRASHSRLMKPSCTNNTSGETKSKKGTGRTRNSHSSQKDSKLALYMPYLTFATLPYNLSPKQKSHELPAYQHANRRHQALMSAYQGKVVHASQTLDQFYYHSLSNTNERDLDQVVTRYIEGTKRRDKWSKSLTILRVDQLWLWVVDNKTIMTCSTHRKDDQEDPVVESIFNYLREESGKRQGQPPPDSVDGMSKFVVNLCVGFVDQYTTNVRDTQESAQQIFAKSINEKAAEEAKLFHNFTRKIDSKLLDLDILRNEDDEKDQTQTSFKESDHNAVENEKIAAKYALQVDERGIATKPQKTSPYASISVATHLLEEVKDIRDELNILKSLLRHQKTVWDDLFKVSAKIDRRRSPDYALAEIEEMDKSAKRIQDSVNSLLGLDQNEANISEAQETTRQGRTLMIFTIVTIVFLPMSFLATLFTLNVASFPHDSGAVLYQPEWIFPILFGTTIAISIPLILFAFKANTILGLFRRNIVKARVRTPTVSTHSQTQLRENSLSTGKLESSRSPTEASDAEKMNPASKGKGERKMENKHLDHSQWNGSSFWRDMRLRKADKYAPHNDALV